MRLMNADENVEEKKVKGSCLVILTAVCLNLAIRQRKRKKKTNSQQK